MRQPARVRSKGDQPAVLLIGVDRYVLRACRRHGVDAVVLCPPGSRDDGLVAIPPGATVVPIDDHRSVEAILAGLHRAGLGDRRFDAVQTTEERAVVAASFVAGLLGCPAIDPVDAVFFRDKALQKDRIRAAGIPTARATVIDDIHRLADEPPPFAFRRAVLKPITGAGTRFTTLLDGEDELRATSRRYRDEGVPLRTFLLEEYVEGDEWVADGVVWDGEVLFFALGRYAQPCLAAVNAQDPVVMYRMDPEEQGWAYALAEPVVRRSLRALGLASGVFHLELFHDRERGALVFGECAARRGGALVQEEVLAKFGVDLGESALRCALGWRPEIDTKIRPEVIGSAYLPGRPGTLFHCPSPAELRAQPNVELARVELPFGTTLSDGFADTMHRLGLVLLAADSLDELLGRVQEIRAWFDARLVVAAPGRTAAQRREWQRANWPDEDFADTLYEQR